MADQRRASQIYAQQNRIIHQTMAALGCPYSQEKHVWLPRIAQVVGREATGLSDLNLGERDRLIKEFQRRHPEMGIRNPVAPKRLRAWKKGDPDIGYHRRQEKDAQNRLILALWAELGCEPRQIRELVRRMFKVDDLRFMDGKMKTRLINYLRFKIEAGGGDVAYHR